MGNLKFCHSCLSLWVLLVAFFCLIDTASASKVVINRQELLVDRLSDIDRQIGELRKKISVEFGEQIPLNSQSNIINWKISQKVQLAVPSLYSNLPQLLLSNIKQSPQDSVSVKYKCSINKQKSESDSSLQFKYHYVTSLGEMFIFVSDLHSNRLQIYSMECRLLARIFQLTVQFVFDQEKTPSNYNSHNKDHPETQFVYLISTKNELFGIDLLEVKKTAQNPVSSDHVHHKNYQSSSEKLHRLLNNKLISRGETAQIIGVLTKTVSHQGSRSKQTRSSSTSYREKSLFIAFDSTEIKVYDQIGTLKITMKQPSVINDLYMEANPEVNSLSSVNDKALQFIDIHPQPILVQQNWIYFVDTGKYSRQPWGCPFITNVKKLFVQNYHDSQVYLLTDQRIFKINVKPKDNKEISKKGLCSIEKSIPYFDPYLKFKKTEDIAFYVFKNLIFLDNLVYNMTSHTYLTVHSAESLLGKDYAKGFQCKSFQIQPIPHIPPSSKKTPLQKHLTLIQRCHKHNITQVHVFTVTQIKSESSLLVYIIVGFMMVIFFAIKCFKSTNSSYEKELLFPVNFQGQDKQIRKEHYEQLKKYMDEAKTVEKQDKTAKVTEHEQTKGKGQKRQDKKNFTQKKSTKAKGQ